MDDAFRIGTWLVQPNRNTLSYKGTTVRLEPKVMEVLVCLARLSGEPVSKHEFLKTVWPDTFVTDDVLTRSISELRRVLEDDAREPRFIETIPKRGYRLIARVERLNGSAPALEPGVAIDHPENDARAPRSGRSGVIAVALLTCLLVFFGSALAFNIDGLRDRLFGNRNLAIHSIAVLPLKNLSGDPEQKYFTDGMTEELITDLSQISALKVISRTSSEVYTDTHKTLPEIARELKVDAIVEGSVERSGHRVRITAQLIYAPQDRNLWARSYDRDLKDALALQGTIARAVADEIRVQVAPNEQARLSAPRAVSASVLDAYLEGNYHLHRTNRGFGDEETRTAGQYFQRAINEDASFVPAYIGLAYAHNLILEGGPTLWHPSPQDYAIRKAAATQAAELDPGSSEVHEVLASLDCDEWKWPRAEEELRRAITLNPSRAESHDALGYFLIAIGRPDDGVKELQRAQDVDPNNDHLASAYFYSGRYDESIQLSLRDLQRQPDDGSGHVGLFQTYALTGRYPEAIRELEAAEKLMGFTEFVAPLDRAYKKSGFRAAMRSLTNQLEKLQSDGTIYLPGTLAEIYSLLGDKDRAFYWLEDAYQHKYSLGADGGMLWLKGDPFYGPLHSDPRFADLVRRVGLPQ
jgi:TolB-like protein/DNA-binding winged helix-turn-helix (wHTH) protein/tetratricopeptide (TPR) repeat protein